MTDKFHIIIGHVILERKGKKYSENNEIITLRRFSSIVFASAVPLPGFPMASHNNRDTE
jgi:hypothetical protein